MEEVLPKLTESRGKRCPRPERSIEGRLDPVESRGSIAERSGVSIIHYNPRIMVERSPALVDWFEDLVFNGLLFVAAAQLIYEIAG